MFGVFIGSAIPSQVLSTNDWVHVCVTWSVEDGMSLYLQGELVGNKLQYTVVPGGGVLVLGQVG